MPTWTSFLCLGCALLLTACPPAGSETLSNGDLIADIKVDTEVAAVSVSVTLTQRDSEAFLVPPKAVALDGGDHLYATAGVLDLEMVEAELPGLVSYKAALAGIGPGDDVEVRLERSSRTDIVSTVTVPTTHSLVEPDVAGMSRAEDYVVEWVSDGDDTAETVLLVTGGCIETLEIDVDGGDESLLIEGGTITRDTSGAEDACNGRFSLRQTNSGALGSFGGGSIQAHGADSFTTRITP